MYNWVRVYFKGPINHQDNNSWISFRLTGYTVFLVFMHSFLQFTNAKWPLLDILSHTLLFLSLDFCSSIDKYLFPFCNTYANLETCAFTKLTNKVGSLVSVVLLYKSAVLQLFPDYFEFCLSKSCSVFGKQTIVYVPLCLSHIYIPHLRNIVLACIVAVHASWQWMCCVCVRTLCTVITQQLKLHGCGVCTNRSRASALTPVMSEVQELRGIFLRGYWLKCLAVCVCLFLFVFLCVCLCNFC